MYLFTDHKDRLLVYPKVLTTDWTRLPVPVALKKISLRTTLKQLKESLSTHVSIIQCHRGFIVNLDFVETLQCENNSYYLNLFYVDKKIPVSRTKKADIKAALAALQHK